MNHPPREGPRIWSPLLVAVLTFVAFLPTLHNGFVTWDDDKNFLNNPHYRGLGWPQLSWMWSTFHLGHYVPLSWMTLGLDYVIWGMNPVGYHLTNLLLHAANAVVLYFLARRLLHLSFGDAADERRLTLSAAFAALLFAVHPLRVESVAWATERRDVLSLLFYLLSIGSYLRAAEQTKTHARWYGLAVALLACALLSKATAMTLPAVLLILNVYPLKRLGGRGNWWTESARRVYVELIPFALLTLASVVLSIVALHPPDQLRATAKLAVSAYSLAFYLWKTIAPVHLSPLYEMPRQVDPLAAMFVVSYGAVVVLAVVALAVRRRFPGATAALLAFAVITLPMLGVVQNGPQIAADRYTYHAAPALAILAGAGVLLVQQSLAIGAIGTAVLVALGALTWRQTRVWQNTETLWSHALAVDAESSIAHSAWASLLLKQNRVDEAFEHGRRAVTLAPNDAEAHNALGVTFARQGRLADAADQYQQALALKPASDETQNNWGILSVQEGDLDRAVEHYRQALAINPDNADAHVNWGNALVRIGKPDEAIAHYEAALRIRPDHADAHHNWGVALARQGRLGEAIEHFRQVLAINPDHAEAKEYLAKATQLLR